jgi:hypothetical protein
VKHAESHVIEKKTVIEEFVGKDFSSMFLYFSFLVFRSDEIRFKFYNLRNTKENERKGKTLKVINNYFSLSKQIIRQQELSDEKEINYHEK